MVQKVKQNSFDEVYATQELTLGACFWGYAVECEGLTQCNGYYVMISSYNYRSHPVLREFTCRSSIIIYRPQFYIIIIYMIYGIMNHAYHLQ